MGVRISWPDDPISKRRLSRIVKLEPTGELYYRDELDDGAAAWVRRNGEIVGLHFVCPCGCKVVAHVAVKGTPSWKWDGDEVSPTLIPSIDKRFGCRWHGHLTRGEFHK